MYSLEIVFVLCTYKSITCKATNYLINWGIFKFYQIKLFDPIVSFPIAFLMLSSISWFSNTITDFSVNFLDVSLSFSYLRMFSRLNY